MPRKVDIDIIDHYLKNEQPLLVYHAKKNKCYCALKRNIAEQRMSSFICVYDYDSAMRWSDTPEGHNFWMMKHLSFNELKKEL